MAEIKVINLTKIFDEKTVLDNINITIGDKELLVFVGPSGCGKSTAMRCVAGLEEVTSGEIYIDDKLVNHLPAKDRDIAFIFQNYALYPHMNVYDNISFGLRARKVLIDKDDPKAKPRRYRADEIETKVKKTAKILGIEDLLKRKPSELSGGQQQRVAMGRAIIREPKVFLMDEPLSNLDAKLRTYMRTELKKIQINLGVTTIYVTHDQAEAMTLGDRIACMYGGIFQQIGTPEEVYDRPVNKFVAGFIGSPSMNLIDGKIKDKNFVTEYFTVELPDKIINKLNQQDYDKNDVILGIRPEDIEDIAFSLNQRKEWTVTAKILVKENFGSDLYLSLQIGKLDFHARVNIESKAEIKQDIQVVFNLDRAHIFDKESEKNLTL